MKKIILMLSMLMFVGCVDSVNIEKRDFALAMGISEGYKVSMVVPVLDDEKGEIESAGVQVGEGESLRTAIDSIDRTKGNSLYIEHIKLIVLSEDIYSKKEEMKKVFKELSQDERISKSTLITYADSNVNKILSEDDITDFVFDIYFSDNKKYKKFTLEQIHRSLLNDEEVTLPKIYIFDDDLRVDV